MAKTARRRRQHAGAKRSHYQSDVTYAVSEGNIEALTQLLTDNPDAANIPDRTGLMPLGYAIRSNNIDAARVLLEHGADANMEYDEDEDSDYPGSTLLHVATIRNRFEMVQLMLRYGGNPHTIINNGLTVFEYVIQRGTVRMVEIFLENGVDVNGLVYGDTPLLTASIYKRVDIAQRLIELGADVNKRNSKGYTPFHAAVASNRVFFERGIQAPTLSDVMLFLIERGADINIPNSHGSTPLYTAIEQNKVQAVHVLIQHDVDVNQVNPDGHTPLYAAVLNERVEIVRLLINAGAAITQEIIEEASPDIRRFLTPPVPTAKWKGYGKSTMETFESQLFNGGPDSLTSFALCPVCLGTGTRDAGCNYMNHVCNSSDYVNNKLYNKYSTSEGIVWWCAVCGRICNGHRHYELAAHNAPRPALNASTVMYGTTCSPGGGNVEEKIARFREMLDTYSELQGQIDTITRKEALDLVTTRMWDAPLHIAAADSDAIATIIANKSFGIDPSVFSNNATSAPMTAPGPTATAPPGSFEAPEVFMGENSISYHDDIPVIRFKHKNASGVMHTHEYVVGVRPTLIDHIKRSSDTKYKCFEHECGGLLWPEEIELAFEHELIKPSITDEDKTSLANYKRRFYAAYTPAGGGRRATRKRKVHRKLQRKRMTRHN